MKMTRTSSAPDSAAAVRDSSRSRKLAVSLAFSVGVHLVILALLLTVALQVAPWRERVPDARPEITLTAPARADATLVGDVALSLPDPGQVDPPGAPRPAEMLPGPDVRDGLAGVPSGIPPGGGVDLGDVIARGQAPKGVQFAGVRTRRASRIVYVVDGSGAMVTSLPFVLDELRRSVARLDEDQSFAVVLFRNRPPETPGQGPSRFDVLDGDDGGLLRATADSRALLRAWTEDLSPEGISNPLDGLTRAFAFSPDAVFLLARSIPRSGQAQWGVGVEAILRELEQLNPADPRSRSRLASIKTIQFLAEDPTGTMQAIGERHGSGSRGEAGYTLLTLEDLEALPARASDPVRTEEPIEGDVDRAVARLATLRRARLDIAVLFGLAGEAQTNEVTESCREVIRLVDQSGSGSPVAAFARARAQMLLAHAENDTSIAARARVQLDAISDEAGPPLSAIAGASALSAMTPDETGSTEVLVRLRTIESALASEDPISLAEARMSALRLTGATDLLADLENDVGGPPFKIDGERDVVLSLAAADVVAGARLRSGDQEGAFDQFIFFLNEGLIPPDLAIDYVGRLVPDDVEVGQLPPDILYAEGLDRARKAIQGASDLLARAAEQADAASEPVRRRASRDAALARLGEPDLRPEERRESVETLWSYVLNNADAPDRARVLISCLLACDQAQRGERLREIRSDAVALFATASFAGHARASHARAGVWLSTRARELLKQGGPEARDEAIRLLDSVPRDAEGGDHASKLRVYARSLEVADLQRQIVELRRSEPRQHLHSDQVQALAREIVAVCERMANDARASGPELSCRWLIDSADARVELGESPLEAYESLAGSAEHIPGGESRRRIGIARSHLNAVRPDLAFPILRDLVEQLDASASGAHPEVFWHAWALLLDILRDRPGREEDIAIRVLRLRQIDPELGGEPWRTLILGDR